MGDLLNAIDSFVWGPPLLILLVGTGLWLTIRLSLLQVTKLPLALKLIFSAKNEGEGDTTSFGALCTALAATVGTGNIVGVATAIKMGGPGALFWMWLAAFFGMATKYAEGCLAVRYRTVDANGQIAGGPMYYIENGLGPKFKPLAILFAIFGAFAAACGIGNVTQVHSIAEACGQLGINPLATSITIAVLVAAVTIGGIQSIANVSSKIVPGMAVFYFISCAIVLISHVADLPAAVGLVFREAFTPTAEVGGFAGATVMMGIQYGIARGVFSNESGLGSAPIAAAAAKTKWAAEQGLVSMTGTFIDTIIICSLTGLSLIVTNAWTSDTAGAAMTQTAFASVLGDAGTILVTISLSLFAFTTILGWNYYGERCFEYLAGLKYMVIYRGLFIGLVAIAPLLKLDEVWTLADIANGLMAVPNLIALILLTGVICKETNDYLNNNELK